MSDLISRQRAIDTINSMFAIAPTQIDMVEDCLEIIKNLPSAQTEIIRCEDCMHNGSFDTDCPIRWNGKEYCSFAESENKSENI